MLNGATELYYDSTGPNPTIPYTAQGSTSVSNVYSDIAYSITSTQIDASFYSFVNFGGTPGVGRGTVHLSIEDLTVDVTTYVRLDWDLIVHNGNPPDAFGGMLIADTGNGGNLIFDTADHGGFGNTAGSAYLTLEPGTTYELGIGLGSFAGSDLSASMTVIPESGVLALIVLPGFTSLRRRR